jgi:hypothetical protein
VLAKELDLVGPNLPELSAQDFADLTVLDHLTQNSAQFEQLLATRRELTERAAWNFEASFQLGRLTTMIGDIPFKTLPEPAATLKGKERAMPKKLSILGINSEDSGEAWDNHSECSSYIDYLFCLNVLNLRKSLSSEEGSPSCADFRASIAQHVPRPVWRRSFSPLWLPGSFIQPHEIQGARTDNGELSL